MIIKCSKCGYENPPTRLYCLQCKARLSLEQVSKDIFSAAANHFEYGRRLILTAILVIVAGLFLALWPDQVEVPRASAEELGQARGKLLKLQKGVATEPMVFSEKEVNLLFNYLLREGRRKPTPGMELAALSAAGVSIKPVKMIVRLNYQYGPFGLGAVPLGPFFISYTFNGVPERGPDGLRFTAHTGAIGHLPLPLVGRKLAAKRLERVFNPFKNARVFMSSLEITEMNNGSVAVAVARGVR